MYGVKRVGLSAVECAPKKRAARRWHCSVNTMRTSAHASSLLFSRTDGFARACSRGSSPSLLFALKAAQGSVSPGIVCIGRMPNALSSGRRRALSNQPPVARLSGCCGEIVMSSDGCAACIAVAIHSGSPSPPLADERPSW